MGQTATKTQYTNPLAYPELRVEGFTPFRDLILCQWEEAHEEIKYRSLSLIRPETKRAIHYTGVVLAVGPQVKSDEIRVGHRIFFEQFSGFEKYFDPEWGRLALCKEAHVLAVVPPRVKVESGEEDFDYSK